MWILSMLATGSFEITDNSGLRICKWLEGNLINMGRTMQGFQINQIFARKTNFEKLCFND